MDDEDVKQMLDGIEKIAQCPVCLDIAKGPVAQCSNGHITCGTCKPALTECSVCRGPFIDTANRIVEELLNFLPKLCPYTDEGCNAVSLLDNHSQYCEFRPIKCLVGFDMECLWTGTVNEWREHVNEEHKDDIVKYNFNNPIVVNTGNIKDWGYSCFYHEIGEELFLFCVWKDGNKLCFTLNHVQCKKPKHEYYLIVKFVTFENFLYKSCLVSSPVKDGRSLEINPVFFLLEHLHALKNKNGGFNFKIEALRVDFPEE